MNLETELQQALAAQRLSGFQKLARILRHYRWSQLLRRGVRLLRERVARNRVVGTRLAAPSAELRPLSATRQAWAQLEATHFAKRSNVRATDLSAGRLSLLNEVHSVGFPIEWTRLATDPKTSHLWRFHLQYHEFLLGQVACQGPSSWPVVWENLKSWLATYPPEQTRRTSDSWHPYCLSRRIPVWCALLALGKPPAELRQLLLNSLAHQANHLAEHLEFELGGNHLLENLAALTIANAFLDVPTKDRWIERVLAVWDREESEQILPHGEHVERSPMYHAQVAGNLLRQAGLQAECAPHIAQRFRESASKLLDFLNGILHPDGEIPLFADSGFGEAPTIDHLQDLAAWNQLPFAAPATQASDSVAAADLRVNTRGPYWRATWQAAGESLCVMVDGGECGAPHLPAHAHADLTTLEVSINRRRWIVDSGNGEYAAGPLRDYCRSSVAHNVLTLGFQNSCEVWGAFRMGERGAIRHRSSGSEAAAEWFCVAHDGYRKQGADEIRRLVWVNRSGTLAVADQVAGETPLPARGLIHFAPELEVSCSDTNPMVWRVRGGEGERWLRFFHVDRVDRTTGWVCTGFGERRSAPVLVYERQQANGPALVWVLGLRVEDLEAASRKASSTLARS